jgi:hypothetical protein
MFCLTAPIALVGELGSYVVPFVGIIAWSLFGIQEIGTQMAWGVATLAINYSLYQLLPMTSLCSWTYTAALSIISSLLPRHDDRGALSARPQTGGIRQHHQERSI